MTALPNTLRMVSVDDDRYEEWLDRFLGTFGQTARGDVDLVGFFRKTHPAARAIAVDSEIGYLATGSALELSLALPGGAVVPMAGVTGLTVDPTARRQGVLRTMMTELHRRAREEDVPVAGLGASEWRIYGRFGYGPATWFDALSIDAQGAGWLTGIPGSELRPRLITDKEAKDLARTLHQRCFRATPGDIGRPEGYWDRFTAGAAADRVEATLGLNAPDLGPRRCVAIDDTGVACYRIKSDWTPEETPRDKLVVTDLLAADSATEAALWRFLLSVDLVTEVQVPRIAVDHPLRWWVTDARRLRPHRHDGLWLRPLDVVRLLESRDWSGSGRLTLAVHDDEGFADGTFRLDVDDGRGTCERTTAEADMTMDVATLGAIVLGGTSAVSMAAADRIRSAEPRHSRLWDSLAVAVPAPFCRTNF